MQVNPFESPKCDTGARTALQHVALWRRVLSTALFIIAAVFALNLVFLISVFTASYFVDLGPEFDPAIFIVPVPITIAVSGLFVWTGVRIRRG
jgi:hypothetical protein